MAAEQLEAANVPGNIDNGQIVVRRVELERRVREVREENCRNGFSSFVICLVFTILLLVDNKDWEWLRQRYPEPAFYLLISTF